ncbi:hypothetical protein D3C81_1786400 [compost metagenome]
MITSNALKPFLIIFSKRKSTFSGAQSILQLVNSQFCLSLAVQEPMVLVEGFSRNLHDYIQRLRRHPCEKEHFGYCACVKAPNSRLAPQSRGKYNAHRRDSVAQISLACTVGSCCSITKRLARATPLALINQLRGRGENLRETLGQRHANLRVLISKNRGEGQVGLIKLV